MPVASAQDQEAFALLGKMMESIDLSAKQLVLSLKEKKFINYPLGGFYQIKSRGFPAHTPQRDDLLIGIMRLFLTLDTKGRCNLDDLGRFLALANLSGGGVARVRHVLSDQPDVAAAITHAILAAWDVLAVFGELRPEASLHQHEQVRKSLNRLALLPTERLPHVAPRTRPYLSGLSHHANFVGRSSLLTQIAEVLKATSDGDGPPPAVALIGTPGIGKTQLAVECAWYYGGFFGDRVYWIHAGAGADIEGQIARYGKGMNLHAAYERLSLERQVKLVLAAWQAPIPRLLIVDALDDVDGLKKIRLMLGGCRLIITTLRPDWPKEYALHIVPVQTLERSDSVALLRSLVRDPSISDDELRAIAQELGDLPLALHLAGNFLGGTLDSSKHHITAAEYIEHIQDAKMISHLHTQRHRRLISLTKHELDIARTFRIACMRLSGPYETLARDLLARLAWFAPAQPISPMFLSATLPAARRAPPHILEIEGAIRQLVRYGIVEQTADTAELRIHQLLARFAQQEPHSAAARADVERAVLEVAEESHHQDSAFPLHAINQHVRYITQTACAHPTARAAALCSAVGSYFRRTGQYIDAEASFADALRFYGLLGIDNQRDVLEAKENLGLAFELQGDSQQAQRLFREVLEARTQLFGLYDIDTATAYNNLGFSLVFQARYYESRCYLEQARILRTTLLGEQHRATARVLRNLGHLAHCQGDYDRAIAYLEHATGILRQTESEGSLLLAQTLKYLGDTYRSRGALALALIQFEETLKIRTALFDQHHHDVAEAYAAIGWTKYLQGHPAEATQLLEQALSIYRDTLGGDSREMINTLQWLGRVRLDAQQFKQSRSYLLEAYRITKKWLNPHHPLRAEVVMEMEAWAKATSNHRRSALFARLAQQVLDAHARDEVDAQQQMHCC